MVPEIEMSFSPVRGGYIPRECGVSSTTQRIIVKTPYGIYDALVRCVGTREELFYVDSIRKIER